jgi:tetratricopeptide (TPR) repeat protein
MDVDTAYAVTPFRRRAVYDYSAMRALLAWRRLAGWLGTTAVMVCAAGPVCAASQTPSRPQPSQSVRPPAADQLKQQFESAMVAYREGRHSDALTTLQRLLRVLPDSPDVNELAGLVFAASGQHETANPYLAKAVRLAPDAAPWRTALAVNLLKLGRKSDAELQFRKVVAMRPDDYDASHNLGEFYVQIGRLSDAIPYLTRAQQLRPAAYDNGYDLALALVQVGRFDEARQQVLRLVESEDKAELHSLLGHIEEKAGNYIAAAREYERAAHLDPSEENIFAWGAELLLHQTFDPAMAVFRAGLERFPQSARLHLGVGIAQYGSGRADDAARTFCGIWDGNPSDPLPLRFAGTIYDSLSDAADHVKSRLAQFLRSGRQDAAIAYRYATALWNEHQQHPEAARVAEVESLLMTAVTLQPDYTEAHLQLGVVYADQQKYDEAARHYRQAVALAPNVAAAHYRLGRLLARMGDKSRAQEEFAIYERLRSQEVADTQKQSAEIQQFVYTMRDASGTATKPNQQ